MQRFFELLAVMYAKNKGVDEPKIIIKEAKKCSSVKHAENCSTPQK